MGVLTKTSTFVTLIARNTSIWAKSKKTNIQQAPMKPELSTTLSKLFQTVSNFCCSESAKYLQYQSLAASDAGLMEEQSRLKQYGLESFWGHKYKHSKIRFYQTEMSPTSNFSYLFSYLPVPYPPVTCSQKNTDNVKVIVK